jgi:hypothetical protein
MEKSLDCLFCRRQHAGQHPVDEVNTPRARETRRQALIGPRVGGSVAPGAPNTAAVAA